MARRPTPLWVYQSLLVGGAVLGAVAGRLPPDIQDLALWGSAALIVVGGVGYLSHELQEARRQKISTLPVIGMAACIVAFFACVYWYHALNVKAAAANITAAHSLRNLSDDDIRARVAALTARMRTAQGENDAAQARFRAAHPPAPLGTPPEERKRIFRQETAEQGALSDHQKDEYRRHIQPDAQALRAELIGRLRIKDPAPKTVAIILDQGILAGPNPQVEVAEYLEQLARQLPQ